jgi:hypothetical protein
MTDRTMHFATLHRRKPTDFEWYLLWNCPADVDQPSKHEAARAQRFENLCERSEQPRTPSGLPTKSKP